MTAALRSGWNRLLARAGDALPALMVFGPSAAVASLLAATIAELRA